MEQNQKRQIPLVDLKRQYAFLKEEIDAAIQTVLQNAHFIMGEEVHFFEKEFAAYIETSHCISVNSGTDALLLGLQALGIRKGDEVLLPVNTFVATAFAVTATGATPIFVDIDPRTYLIDTKKIESQITSRTKAIIPVHLYGQAAPMEHILRIATKYSLFVIEDACQAHGATYKTKRIGTFGTLGCFSFYPGKNLGAYGDGGAIVTSDSALAEKLCMLRQYGERRKYLHECHGTNSRLDTVQAAVLRVKLRYLDQWNKSRIQNAKRYDAALSLSQLLLQKPNISSDGSHVYHLYVVRVHEREKLQQFLSQQGICTGIHYPVPLHLQEAYKSLDYKRGDFPHAEKAAEEILSLPLFPELKEEDIEFIASVVKKTETLL